jgi:hypothetical protein
MRIGSFYTAFAIGICTTAALHSQDEADLLEVSLSELLDMKVRACQEIR